MAGITDQARVGQGSLLLAVGLALVLFDVRVDSVDVLHDIAGGLFVLIGAARLVSGINEAGWPGGMVVVGAGLVLLTTLVAQFTESGVLVRVLTALAMIVLPSLALLMREALADSGRHRLAALWAKNLVIVSTLVVPAGVVGIFVHTIDSTATLIVILVFSAAALFGFLHTLLALVSVWASRAVLEAVMKADALVEV